MRGYRLLERIGDGSIGTVFRAIQPHVERDVAIKVIHERVAADPGFARRFESEAQAAAGLEHPHIVTIHDYWREPQAAYVVSRFMRGGSLQAALDRGDEPDTDRATEVVRQVASALAYAHGRGIGHGNVSTSSILLDEQGNAYLGGFPIGFGPPVDPSDDLQALESIVGRLLREVDGVPLLRALGNGGSKATDPHDVDGRSAGPTAIRNPYKGLRAFLEADAEDYFGRRGLVDHLIDRMREPGPGARFVAVIGPSGSGKSSVVRAGLLPAIRAGSVPDLECCFIAEMVPGAHPTEELGTALTKIAVGSTVRLRERLESGPRGLLDAAELVVPEPSELIVVVDQFEELYTLTQSQAERESFVEALRVAVADPASRVRVIVTLRADHFDRPLAQQRFAELLGSRSVTVPPLSADEMEEAIRRPAERVGADVESGLVVEMVSDVAHQPGPLPLVQYALTELFEQREEDRLTLRAYREIGGVAGALSARADRLYEARDAAGKRSIEQVFLRLVRLGEGRQDTRRRVTIRELHGLQMDPAVIDDVLDAFGRHRFLTFDREPATREPTVEIAHEALLTAWSRLAHWIDDAREDLRQEQRLARAAAEWRGSDRDPSFLIAGARLTQLETWAASSRISPGMPEREYLAASVHQRELQQAAERARAELERGSERRSRRLVRGLVAVLAIGMLVATTLTVIAVQRGGDAARQSRVAFARELAAASEANLDVDAERSMLLALEAIETTRSPRRHGRAGGRGSAAPSRDLVANRAHGEGDRWSAGLEPGRIDLRHRGAGRQWGHRHPRRRDR